MADIPRMQNVMSQRSPAGKVLTGLFALSVLITAVAYFRKGQFVDHTQVKPELLNEPVQTPTTRQVFSFDYMDSTYHVKPVADYLLHGLVVSHNNIYFLDPFHDSTSVDTKDVAVIWADNLRSNEFHKVKFWNTSSWVHWRYPSGVRFYHNQIANNHLITSSDSVRDLIGRVRVGDQIRIKGMLVDYQDIRNPSFWRKSSRTRLDTGDGACEVLFVQELKILARATPGWYMAYSIGWWGIVIVPVVAIGRWFYVVCRWSPTSTVGEFRPDQSMGAELPPRLTRTAHPEARKRHDRNHVR